MAPVVFVGFLFVLEQRKEKKEEETGAIGDLHVAGKL